MQLIYIFIFYSISSAPQLSLEDGLREENIQYKYKVYNNGPSTVKELSLSVFVPIVYTPYPNYFVPIVNFSDVMGFYINKVLDYKIISKGNWVTNNKNENGLNQVFDSSKMGYDYEMNAERSDQDYNTLGQSSHRKKRNSMHAEIEEPQQIFNRYSQSLVEDNYLVFSTTVDKEDTTLANLPRNRTIVSDCIEDLNECVEIQFTIRNFRPGSEPINVNFNFSMNLNKMGKIFKIFIWIHIIIISLHF